MEREEGGDIRIFRYGTDGAQSGAGWPEGTFFILATACVAPKPVPGLVRVLPQDRLSDYVKACAWWLALDDDRLGTLVILENSGYDPVSLGESILAELETRGGCHKRGMEIITYYGPDRPIGLHYGYSEFQMIDDLLDRSLSAKRYRLFIKTTGRYLYPDISRLLDRWCFGKMDNKGRYCHVRLRFLCDSKNIPRFLWRKPARSASVGLFVTSLDYYNNSIRSLYKNMDDRPRHTHIEDIIYDKLLNLHSSRGIFIRFPTNCEPNGIGGNGEPLFSTGKRIKALIRGVCRVIAPTLWI